jgi:alkyl hydroperoxide reductase subunit AhpC
MSYEDTIDVCDEVPSFDLESQLGRMYFRDVVDSKWCLLIMFSSAFDPVTTTDFGLLSKLMEEFESRNIVILAVGNDSGKKMLCLTQLDKQTLLTNTSQWQTLELG